MFCKTSPVGFIGNTFNFNYLQIIKINSNFPLGIPVLFMYI